MEQFRGSAKVSRMKVVAWLVIWSAVAHGSPASIEPKELRHVVFDRVVIADAKGDWGTGPITMEKTPSEQDVRLVMTRAIDPKRVPAALRAWSGRKVVIGDDRCASAITSLQLLAITEPEHESGFWNRTTDPLPASGETLATWNASEVWLVGEFAGCADRVWARAAELKAPAIAKPTVIADKLRDDALATFRALPAYRSVQARFHADGEWEASDSGVNPVLRFDLAGRTLVSHVAEIEQKGLVERLLAIWELADGKLVLRHVATTKALPARSFGLAQAIDPHGDGRALFVYRTNDSRGGLYEAGDTVVEVPALRLATP
jgi:hypothetical protein